MNSVQILNTKSINLFNLKHEVQQTQQTSMKHPKPNEKKTNMVLFCPQQLDRIDNIGNSNATHNKQEQADSFFY